MGNSFERETTQPNAGAGGNAGMSVGGGAPQGTKEKVVAQGQSFIDSAKTSAQSRVRSATQNGKAQAVQVVGGLAQSLLMAGQQLRDQQSPVADAIEQAAERLDSVTQFLDNTEPEELMRRTENWARKNPALFVGAAFVVGALGARFLKSSKPVTPNLGDGNAGTFSDREVPRPMTMETV
jgi:ElaB/YqjD/DUF883 family membrane-anchored ribosome-binding protein